MPRRQYSSIAQRTTLSSGMTAITTTMNITAATGLPSSFPYTMIIAPDTTAEEVVEVTARAGTVCTVTRGVDGTTAVVHSTNDVVQHGFSARDFDDANAFINVANLNTQTANYVAAASDTGKVIQMNVGSANTFTIPPYSTTPQPTGATFDVVQLGAGQTTITPGAGVTLLSYGGSLKLTGQYCGCTIYQTATQNTWVVIGDLSP